MSTLNARDMSSRQAGQEPAKDVALALSSGGARGLAHIGAIEALQARGYSVTSVAGTSFGAIVGAMYACGKLQEFRQWMATMDKRKRFELTDYALALNHFVKGQRVIRALIDIAPDRLIEDLDVPFRCIATDWKTGREVIFSKGSMWRAVRASISVPGTMAPVKTFDKILIDGGITNPLPLDRVPRQKGDLLMGVNVSGHDYESQWRRRVVAREKMVNNSRALSLIAKLVPEAVKPGLNYYNLLDRTLSIAISQNARRQVLLSKPDILVDIPMRKYEGTDYDKSEEIIEVGRRKTNDAIKKYEANFA